jgi:hypothetical protein
MVVTGLKYDSDSLWMQVELRGWHATCTCGSPCKLHVSQRLDLLLRRRGQVLIVARYFIHERFCDVGSEPFQSITGSGTLLSQQ